MKVNYKQPDSSVNVSKVSPLKRLVQLLAGLMISLIIIYFILGMAVDLFIPYIPSSLESKMGEVILSQLPMEEDKKVVQHYEDILDKLIGNDESSKYTIEIINSSQVNAFAIPGNTIVFSSAFVDEIVDEEMIAFVLGHEMGHFEHRDHLKRYGRMLILYAIVNLVNDSGNALSNFSADILSKTEMKFSQNDELKADAFGAELIKNTYGSYDGGIRFFEIIKEEYNHGEMASYFDSHPHPEKRIESIKNFIK